MIELAESFFDYSHSAFRDESDFAGLFRHACGLLDMPRVKPEAVFIVRRALARGGIADEHWSIFVLTIELRLREFDRLGELEDWLLRLEYHTEKQCEPALDGSFVSPGGLVCRVVRGATPPLPPTQVTFLGSPNGNPRGVKRQVVKLWPESSTKGRPSVSVDDVDRQVSDGQSLPPEQSVENKPRPLRQKAITTIQSSRFFGRDGPLGSAEDLATRLAIRAGSGTQAGILGRLTRGYGSQGKNSLDDSLREQIIDLIFSLYPDDDARARRWVRLLTKEFPPRKSTPKYLIA